MDSFIKIIEQKNNAPKHTLHNKEIELLKKYINDSKNVFICGAVGSGKTFILNSVLDDFNSVELQKERISSSSPFLNFIKTSRKHLYIDDFTNEFKPFINKVSDGENLSKGSLIVTSTKMCMYPNFETIIIPKRKPSDLLSLIDTPSIEAENAAIRSDGNIRNFFSYLDGSHDKDVFKTSKEFAEDILCSELPLGDLETIHEHGHVWDLIQENYIYSEGVDINKCCEAFTLADICDQYMYKTGDWECMPYFILNAIIIPKLNLGDPLKKEKVKPGRCWTKYGNYKARLHKYNDIKNKQVSKLDIDTLSLLKLYAEKGNLEPLVEYKITPQDFDVINHLMIGNNLKQRDVTKVKKALKDAYGRGRGD
jgi:hypothetical protein